MRTRISKRIQALALLGLFALAQQAAALGLGTIEVQSHLNEPLQVRIPVTGLKANELENLRAGLATEASFERAGLPRTYLLTQLKFSTQSRSNGRGYIRISTRDAVREPSLSFIVHVTSSTGSLERRYEALLNMR